MGARYPKLGAMVLVPAHGARRDSGNGTHRIEVAKVQALPAWVPEDPSAQPPPVRREADGRFADRESALIAAARGGRAKRGKTKLAAGLGLSKAELASPEFAPYKRAAAAYRKVQVRHLAQYVGGGVCGPGPASIVATAALQLAASRYAFEVLGDMVAGSRLGDASRQNLLAAHELCAREAQIRRQQAANNRLDLGKEFG